MFLVKRKNKRHRIKYRNSINKHKYMALIKSVRGFVPQYGKNCFFAENATIIGDVIMGNDCSIWFNTVLRGDVNSIRIGNNVNIQDGSVLHTLYKKSVIEIGNDVSIGHNVTIHGARIEDNALIGMGSVLLDHAVIGEGAIVAAGSVVLSNTQVEPFSIYAGIPAKFVKMADPEQTRTINKRISDNYQMYASWYKEDDEI
jgi:carbonic anhydrase/acetyltransferase-like protein (isoleucine patch superfamily)